jgi:hypothetical protein
LRPERKKYAPPVSVVKAGGPLIPCGRLGILYSIVPSCVPQNGSCSVPSSWKPQAAATLRDYFSTHPQQYSDLRGILAPIADTERQCNVAARPPNLDWAYHQFMGVDPGSHPPNCRWAGGAMISAMDVDHPEDDQRWDRRERGETEIERLDRNWNSLLQELRVVQTGVQLLTGFLLTLPFQQRFDVLGEHMRMVYLATVGFAVGATVLLISPVAMHRMLFRRHLLQALVSAAHRCAIAGLALLGLAMTGMTIIIFAAVSGRTAGLTAGACAMVLFVVFWLIMPLLLRGSRV